MSQLPLAITCGDPAGVGPEVIEAWLADDMAVAAAGRLAVLGPPGWLARLPAGRFEPFPLGQEDYASVPGQPDGEGALVAWAAMQRAAEGCARGEFSGVVTGPVSKSRLAAIGYAHPGQTEFFASAWGGEPTMGFTGGRLNVILATWHIPLAAVPTAVTPEVIERAVRRAADLALAMRADSSTGPLHIGVCGLNPHAGEDGLLGMEERDVVDPTLDGLRGEFPGLSRALPGDTVFGRALRGEFEVVVALYHDQGLAPLKTLEFDEAVNVTLGLPFVRTSPDHGTGFGIAGRGLARATSFAQAVNVARRLIRHRAQT